MTEEQATHLHMYTAPAGGREDQSVTDYALSTGTPEASGASSFTGPDRIHWSNRAWRVVRVRDWSAFGYCLACAVLLQE